MSDLPRVTVWNENRHEKLDEEVARIYPEGMHAPIAKHLEENGDPRVTGDRMTFERPPFAGEE